MRSVLEFIATDLDHRGKGLASRLLQWGCDAADQRGWECYLDANRRAKSLYERFGSVEQVEKDPEADAVAMLRPARANESGMCP